VLALHVSRHECGVYLTLDCAAASCCVLHILSPGAALTTADPRATLRHVQAAMAEGVRPHHVALCALLRLYLDPAALVARLTPEMYQHVGTVLLGEIRQSTSVSLPSLPELLIDLEVLITGKGLHENH